MKLRIEWRAVQSEKLRNSQPAILLTLLVCVFVLSSRVFAADAIEYSEFPDDVVGVMPGELPTNSIGLMGTNLSSNGLIYKRKISARAQAWVAGSFAATASVPDFDRRPFPGIEASTSTEKDQLLFLFGVDRTIYLTSSHRLGIILGAGAGYRQSRYEVKLYPRICARWCGFNLDHYVETSGTDRFALFVGRLAFGWLDRQFFGQKVDFVLSLMPLLARSPERIRLSAPGVPEIDPASEKQGLMSLEIALRI
jgi:hypothetical protein